MNTVIVRSLRAQHGLSWAEAMANEFTQGVGSLESGEAVDGARRFADGTGRHGAFDGER